MRRWMSVLLGSAALVAAVVGQLAARSRRQTREAKRLTEEQMALRRVATLVARSAPASDVFEAVTGEVGLLCGADLARMERYEEDGTVTGVAGWSRVRDRLGVGMRIALEGESIAGRVRQLGGPARVDSFVSASGPIAREARELGIRSSVGCPITVGGRLWGVIAASSKGEAPFPRNAESQIADFTELVATAIANAESRERWGRLAEEQAVLRRVATIVAKGVPPDEVFMTVAHEVGAVLGADATLIVRLDPDGAITILGRVGNHPDHMQVGSRWVLEPDLAMAEVLRTGRPARRDDYSLTPGAFADVIRDMGIQSSVAIPIVVEGQIWGALSAGRRTERFPADTEWRMANFAELVATAVANAESRAETGRLLEEQAALRRVATLVARGPSPAGVSAAVAEEVCRLPGVDSASVSRYEPDGTSVLVAGAGENASQSPNARWGLDDVIATTGVWRTGRSARTDQEQWSDASGPIAAGLRRLGIRSMAASPIVVEGSLWGAVTVWTGQQLLSPDIEERVANFTELVAMAIGNAESRAELAASRARIVAASDSTRRRIERDLHDGAQQRLVSLGLELRMVHGTVPPDLPDVQAGIDQVIDGLTDVLDHLREMSRGIHPAILSEGGLGPALRTLARRSAVPVELDLGTQRRFPEPVEVAVYYVVSEALTNTTKHAHASHADVALDEQDGSLRLSIRDDGVGGADSGRGSGLVGLRDRVEALGGSIDVRSLAGAGTEVVVTLPVQPRQ